MRQIELKALAKINLGLDVLGRRENGYHDVRMVMQTIYLHDYVKIEQTDMPGITVCSNLYYLPSGEGNLAYQAAAMLLQEYKIKTGVKISLKKYIPVAAGLAGGSADAAAVLFGINCMFRLGLSQKRLMEWGLKLGADVPYCIMRGTVLAEGIGEELHQLPPMPKCIVLVAKPAVSISTRAVYEALDGQEIAARPDIDGLMAGLEAQNLSAVAACMGNVLEQVTIPMCPAISEIKKIMLEGGALNAMMSGSGPAVFGLFENKMTACAVQEILWKKELAKHIFVTNIHNVRGSDR